MNCDFFDEAKTLVESYRHVAWRPAEEVLSVLGSTQGSQGLIELDDAVEHIVCLRGRGNSEIVLWLLASRAVRAGCTVEKVIEEIRSIRSPGCLFR